MVAGDGCIWLANHMAPDGTAYQYLNLDLSQPKSVRLLEAVQQAYPGKITDCVDANGAPQAALQWRSSEAMVNVTAAILPHLPIKRQKLVVLINELLRLDMKQVAKPIYIPVTGSYKPFSSRGMAVPWLQADAEGQVAIKWACKRPGDGWRLLTGSEWEHIMPAGMDCLPSSR